MALPLLIFSINRDEHIWNTFVIAAKMHIMLVFNFNYFSIRLCKFTFICWCKQICCSKIYISSGSAKNFEDSHCSTWNVPCWSLLHLILSKKSGIWFLKEWKKFVIIWTVELSVWRNGIIYTHILIFIFEIMAILGQFYFFQKIFTLKFRFLLC